MATSHAADSQTAAPRPTRALADWIAQTPAASVDPRALRWARHCLMDWIGVTVAGAHDPLVAILLAFIPYVLLRGPFCHIVRWWHGGGATRPGL